MNTHWIAIIGFMVFGLLSITFSVAHEFTWWQRRRWISACGVVVGYREKRDDGVCYFPEIQLEDAHEGLRFVSKYGFGKKPQIGATVNVVVNASGDSAEQITGTNRFLFTFIPMAFGLILIVVGINVKPIPTAEKDDGGSPAALHASP